MNPKLPAVTAAELVRVAQRLGFVLRRQHGSHAIYVRASDQTRVVIPMHRGELKRKTLHAIIRDMKVSAEEFQEML